MIAYLALALSSVGALLLAWAVLLAARLGHRSGTAPTGAEPITLLKPLHGPEPQLAANLSSFLDQRYDMPVQMLLGVQRADDPAAGVARTLQARRPGDEVDLVVDPRVHGTNGKVSNLINMAASARHDVLVLSDSDMAVGPDYLAHVVATLARPGVGAVSCLYRGRGDAGFWSGLGAMGIDLHFLPSTLIGLRVGLAHPCMGSTIALRRETLNRIGGFESFRDVLADDYALGEAVRALELTVAIPDLLLTHGCPETSAAALISHELRWNRTVLGIDPGGFAGSVVLHPIPVALIGLMAGGPAPWLWTVAGIALCARAAMARRLDGRWRGRIALIPLRDLLSFALFVATFFVRSVDWRGSRLNIAGGTILAASESN